MYRSSIKYQPVFSKPRVQIDCRFYTYEGIRLTEHIDTRSLHNTNLYNLCILLPAMNYMRANEARKISKAVFK